MTNCEFTTSRGKTIKLQPIAFLIEQFISDNPLPKPPTYEIKTLGGAIETHEHDETTLQTDEDKAAWKAYEESLAKATFERNDRFVRLILTKSAQVEMPSDEDWIREQESYGIKVPTDPLARKLHYIRTELFGSAEDIEELFLKAADISGGNEEKIAQARALFRNKASGNTAS